MEKNKNCALILPYFGEFSNYFPLFIKSCEHNDLVEWLIITDSRTINISSKNVHIMAMTLDGIEQRIEDKVGFKVSLSTPYKLCDYKPLYGFIFQEYLLEYKYWGYCDCDLIFGDLDHLLIPLLDKGYDKLFAAGHLTLYKNNYENNRRFMKALNGRLIYKEAITTKNIYAFDEDFFENNIHSLFLQDGAKVFCKDLSMNASVTSGKYIRDFYDPKTRKFIKEKYTPARYYWENGSLQRVKLDNGIIKKEEFIYMHFQMRKMRSMKSVDVNCFQILPDRFIPSLSIPTNEKELKLWSIKWPYLYWIDVFCKKIKRTINKM